MLKIDAEKLGSGAILHLEGKIVVGEETTTLRDAVLAQSEAFVVVLDLTNVSLIDAHGVGLLLELRNLVQSNGIEFRLTNVSRLVRQVLEITCLDCVFEISPHTDGRSPEENQPSKVLTASCS
jgi:anti-anti-sigma factor